MTTKSLRYEQRGTRTSGKIPTVTGLLDREIYLNTFDGALYFKNSIASGLHRVPTNNTVDGFNYLKFSGANIGDIPVYNGSGFTPSGLTFNVSGTGFDLTNYVTTGATGNFLTVDQLFFKSGEIVQAYGVATVTGLRYFNDSVSSNWFDNNAWFTDAELTQKSNDLPYDFTDVVICGTNSIYVNIDNPNWIQPRNIDSNNITGDDGICVTSNNTGIFSGYIDGNISFYGNVVFSGDVGYGPYSSICCIDINTSGYGSSGVSSYLVNTGSNKLCGSSYSTILNGTGNTLAYTNNSAIIGSNINVVSGISDTLYVNNICVSSGGYIYGNVSGYNNGGEQGALNPYRSASTICKNIKLYDNTPVYLDISDVHYSQYVSFSASIIANGDDSFYSSKIDGMVVRSSELTESNLTGTTSVRFVSSSSTNLYAISDPSYCVCAYADAANGSLKLKIISDVSNEIDWFAKVDLMKIIKE